MVALGKIAQWHQQQRQDRTAPAELLPREATRRTRVSKVVEALQRAGAPVNFLDLHVAVGDPRDRSDFRKLLREMEEDGTIQIEKAAYAPKGSSPITIRLADAADPEPDAPTWDRPIVPRVHPPEVNGLSFTQWRSRYAMLCSLIRRLGEGGVHQVEHLRAPFDGTGLFFDTIIANLKNRGAVTAPSDSTLSASTLELQKVWDSEEALCSVGGWVDVSHAGHVAVLLHGATLLEEALAFAELNQLIGFTTVTLRIGVSRSTAFTLQHWSKMERDVLEFASKHNVARSMVLTLRNADPSRRMDLLKRAVEENLSTREVHEAATYGDVGQEQEQQTNGVSTATADAARDPALDILLKMVFGIAGDVSALRQRVDWLANELGYKEKSS
jgi:hypothetical protein